MSIKIKTPAEISIMRKSGEILALVFKEVDKIISDGISTKEIDKAVYDFIKKNNAKPSFKGYGRPPFPASICSSINSEVIHGIPSKQRILKNGDIVGIDIGVYYNGYHTDRAFTYKVGSVSKEAEKLIDITTLSFYNGVKLIKEGIHLGDVSNAIQSTVEEAGFSVVREFHGHGVGASLHEEPSIANYGRKYTGPILKKNMVLAIEPMVNAGSYKIVMKEDEWTIVTKDGLLSSHYEHSVLVTENGFEILTVLPDDESVNSFLKN